MAMSRVASTTVWCVECDRVLEEFVGAQYGRDVLPCPTCEKVFCFEDVLKTVRYREQQALLSHIEGGAAVDDPRDPLYFRVEGLRVVVKFDP